MKKKSLCKMFFVFIFYSSMILYAMENQEIGKTRLGHAVFSWRIKGSKEFRNFMKKKLTDLNSAGNEQQAFIVPSLKNTGQSVMQIDLNGELIGIVKKDDRSTIDLEGSLDEELQAINKERLERLQVGESVTKKFNHDSTVTVTFDNLITLKSKIDNSEHLARLSHVSRSQLISGALHYDWKEKQEREIRLESTGNEIKRFLSFLELDKEGKEKLLAELSVIDQAILASDLHSHGFSKEFGSNYYHLTMQLLKKKIYELLKQNEIAWFREIIKWLDDQRENNYRKLNVARVIEEALKEVMRAIPQALFRWEATDNVESVRFSLNGKCIVIFYKDGTKQLIHMKDKEVKFKEDKDRVILNGGWYKAIAAPANFVLRFSQLLKKVHVQYENGDAIIIDAEEEKINFRGKDIKLIKFYDEKWAAIGDKNNKTTIIDLDAGNTVFESPDDYRFVLLPKKQLIRIKYHDNKDVIINAKNRKKILEKEHVIWIRLSPWGDRVGIKYRGNRVEIINIENKEVIFEDRDIKNIKFSCKGKVAVISYENKEKIIEAKDGRLLFEDDNIEQIVISPTEERALIRYKNGIIKVVDIFANNKEAIFEGKNIKWIDFSPNGAWIGVIYKNRLGRNKARIIAADNGREIFEGKNVVKIKFSPNEKWVGIIYKNNIFAKNKGDLIELTGRPLFLRTNNIQDMVFSPNNKEIAINYEDGSWELLDFTNYDRAIQFLTFKPKQLLFVFQLSQNPHYLAQIQDSDAKRIWQSFDIAMQQKLRKAYSSN